jgi:hypothetical protein
MVCPVYIYIKLDCALSLSLVGYVCKRHRADKTVHKKKCGKKTPRKSHFPTPFVVLFLQKILFVVVVWPGPHSERGKNHQPTTYDIP